MSTRRRYLLSILELEKYKEYLFNYVFYNLIPSQIDGADVRDSGKTKLLEIQGNGVIENQYIPTTASSSTVNNVIYTNNGDGSWTVTGLASANSNKYISANVGFPLITGHKYLISGIPSGASNTTYRLFIDYWDGFYQDQIRTYNGTNATGYCQIYVYSGYNANVVYKPMIIDLTLMYGTGNEPTTLADNRIQALLNRGYIPYNTGEYKASRVSEIEFEGYNLFNGLISDYSQYIMSNGMETLDTDCDIADFQEIVGGKTYVFENVNPRHWSNPSVCFYDKDKNFIYGEKYLSVENKVVQAPSNAKYCKFTIDKTSTNVSIHEQGTRTGYAPHTAPQKIQLPAIYEGNGARTSHDTFAITSSGYVFTRNVWKADLGTLDFANAINQNVFYAQISLMPNACENFICEKYNAVGTNGSAAGSNLNNNEVGTGLANNYIYIKDTSYTVASTFKNANSGNYIYYELATPQVITIPKKHLGCKRLSDFGTWTYLSNNVFYVANNDLKSNTGQGNMPNLFCSKYLTINAQGQSTWLNSETRDMVISLGYDTSRIYLKSNDCSNVNDLLNKHGSDIIFYDSVTEVSDFTTKCKFERCGTINTNEFSWVENQQLSLSGSNSEGIQTTIDGNCYVISGTTTSSYKRFNTIAYGIVNHKYLMFGKIVSNDNNVSVKIGTLNVNAGMSALMTTGKFAQILTMTQTTNVGIDSFTSGTVFSNFKAICNLVDLTLGFGAGKEPTSINDPRIQKIIELGYIPTNTTGTQANVQNDVLCNLNMKVQVK